MQNYFILPNDIIDHKLTNNELMVFSYLVNIKGFTNLFGKCVRVKQTTIAEVCKIDRTTVARVVKSLYTKGYITKIVRSIKDNGQLGTCYYVLKDFNQKNSFFIVNRRAFSFLTAKTIKVYLFLAKCVSDNKCYQSYSDIAQATGMKRSETITSN